MSSSSPKERNTCAVTKTAAIMMYPCLLYTSPRSGECPCRSNCLICPGSTAGCHPRCPGMAHHRYRPVSYTHLDVYKRQPLMLLFPRSALFRLFLLPLPAFLLLLPFVRLTGLHQGGGVKSESLEDVYKRQTTPLTST